MSDVTKTIWIVWATRGEVDLREYPVGWCATEAEAQAEARRLTELSRLWSDRVREEPGDFDKSATLRDAASAALGDRWWHEWDDTVYEAMALERRPT